ncbi:MAG: CHASE3 domain-containing protein, partial [Pedobacter sp.]|nr:CHASE3 domain-containing protein [Pedobacter sp.]
MFKLTFKQQVLAGFTISLIFVLVSAITSYKSVDSMNEDSAWENHTYEVIDVAQELEVVLLNAETGLRGFILTQRSNYMEPYNANANKVLPKVKQLQKLTIDNPSQQAKLDSLEIYAVQKMRDMEEILRTNATSGQLAAIRKVQTDKGKLFKDNMLRVNNKVIQEEQKLLKIRTEKREESATRSTIVVVGSAVLIFGLVSYLFSFIKTTFD